MVWYNPFSWRKKKEKELIEFPYEYARIIFTEQAIHEGVTDDFQKEIQILKDGKIVEQISYTRSDVESIRNSGIPLIDLTIKDKEEFIFDKVHSLTGTVSEVKKI